MAQRLQSAQNEHRHPDQAVVSSGDRKRGAEMHYSITSLKNYRLTASDGVIGHVKDIYFDSHTWTVRYLVVNTGSWLLGREVLIPAQAIGRVDVAEKSIRVNLSLSKIKGAPVSDSALPVSRQDDYAHHEYYGFPPGVGPWVALHASAGAVPGGDSSMPIEWEKSSFAHQPSLEGHNNFYLRSAHDVIGHTVQGSDDGIGCVGDFLIDDADWSIRYLIVNTAIWFGKAVIVPTAAIREVSWDKRTVYLTIPRERVKHAPEYDASHPAVDLEQRLAALRGPDDGAVSPCPTPLR